MDNFDQIWPVLTLVIGGLSWIVGTGLRRGAFLSPYSLILLILISVFGFRPLLMLGEPASFNFYGYDISNGYALATLIGFIGTVSFVTGYGFRRFTVTKKAKVDPKAKVLTPTLPKVTPGRAAFAAWSLIALWLLAMLIVGGGPSFLVMLFAGRSESVNSVFASVPAIVPALPVVSCLVAATVRFQWERVYRYTRPQNIAYWIIAAASIVPPSALGTRRFIIPSVLIMILGALVNSWNRKVKSSWFAAGVAGFLVLAIVPFVRSAGSRVGGETDLIGAMAVYFRDEGVRGTLDNFFLSYDTEMFNYIAYFAPRMGETIPYGMGRGTFGEIFAMPIPAALSPFERWNDVMLGYAFGTSCSLDTVCPVPSVVGVLFSDLSFAGVIAGMLILGLMCANFEGSLLRSSGNYTALLLLAAGFSILFARGNSMAQVWIAFQIFVVWWATSKVMAIFPSPSLRRPVTPRRLVIDQFQPSPRCRSDQQ